ncbi:MAG: Maf family protein [Ardenticatenaceae bacterium]|nr:Maf family protein [Ardenticatenaceae bacterium]
MLILGSTSPRRRELLSELGVEFAVHTAEVDEDVITTPDPADNVLGRARLKGEVLGGALRDTKDRDSWILTADTTVAVDRQILNKPADFGEAWEMLSLLRGRWHQVYTALVFYRAGKTVERVVETAVEMRPYTADEMKSYIQSGDPFDKAGGYAIQHPQFRPVKQISGCYTSVVGLPLCHVRDVLSDLQPDEPLKDGKISGQNLQSCRLCQLRFAEKSR